MANKKRNKKQNKQKSNNNRNKNQKNGSKSRQNSEQSIDSSLTSDSSKTSKPDINGVSNKIIEKSLDLFGDSDKRLDLSSAEKLLPIDKSTLKQKSTQSTNYSPKGLHNLGNTCYLNSVLQIISETHLLFDLLNDRSNDGYVYRVKSLMNTNDWSADRPSDEELETTLGQFFPLTQNLVSFMREMRANGSRTVSPSKVLNTIRKEWTQFEGWAQQDSHELLRCLLDSLKCKEVKRQRRAIISELKTRAEADPNVDDNNLDDDTKARIKSYSFYSFLTPIDTVFGGQLLSSVCCEVCHNTSLNFEPFFDLSLSLTQFTNCYSNTNNVLIEKNEPKTKSNDPNDCKPSTDNSPISGDNKKMTPKERRQQRQQKKAAKREVKLQKKAMNTIDIENSNNICDKNNENFKQEYNPEVDVWPEVVEWNTNCHNNEENGKEDDIKDSSDQPINDSNPEFTDSQEIDRKASEDWTDAWLIDNKDWSGFPNEADERLVESKCESDEDFIIEPLLSDFGQKLVLPSDLNEWDVRERPSKVSYEEEDEDIVTSIDMLYDNNDNKDNENNDWNDWRDEGWPVTDELPFFGPELPPNLTAVQIEVVDEESDEYKAQELDFQSSLDYESELLMSSISDGHKLEIKHSNTDPSNISVDFDPNSETIKQIISLSLETISDNNVEKLPKFDLMRLLSNFTAIEWLSGNNQYFCEMCTKTRGSDKDKQFTNASKRALIALPPPVLTLHLKRFEADGYRRAISLKKISTFVSFPLTFDLSPFVSKMYNYLQPITGQPPVSALIYGLYGVVQHSGTLRSGHYTAYIKFRPNNKNQNKKFANLEPFLPKVENVLKMIENKFFATNNDRNSHRNGATNGYSAANGSHTNGLTSGESPTESVEEENEEYSCSDSDSGKWFHISDSSVTSSSVSAVLKSNAYILFYERIV